MKLKKTVVAAAALGVLVGTMTGLGAATASADSVPPPGAPRKPVETWQGQPVVWEILNPGGHWGVWINGAFLPLT